MQGETGCQETFASTVQIEASRFFFPTITKLDLEYSLFDIRYSLTESKANQKVYMARPEKVAVMKDRVLYILCSMYGVR